ncbi:MAG: NAD(P)-dependent oxidoreductase [Lentisphaeria bacterium]|nr:NAD(P)-dependent oxidoreductase [Lentisphaeria bacterium]
MNPANKIFLTGGTGFFGKSILSMRKRGFGSNLKFVVLSRDPAKFLSANPEFNGVPMVEFISGDIRDFTFPEQAFECILHAAAPAMAMPPGVERDIIIRGTRRMLDFARRCGAKRLLFVSSGAVYGPQPPDLELIPEDFPCHPATEYGIAKYEAEQMCLASGIETVIARCFAFTGLYLNRNIHFAIGNFIRDCLACRDIVIKGDGTPYRSYLYADDLVRWLFKVMFEGKPGRAYNIGSDYGVSILELAQTVRKVLHSQNEIVVCQKPVPGCLPPRYVPDISRIRNELQVKIETGLEEAIRKSAG